MRTRSSQAGTGPIRSPSGLFTRAAWEGDLERAHVRMPRWTRLAEERDRRFLSWVEAEALGLMAQLGRLGREGTGTGLDRSLDHLMEALEHDALWARQQLESAFRHAA